jgi:hypothetical protein
MGYLYTLNNDTVEVEYSGTPYIPAYISGPPEDCYPEEGGEIEIESVEYETSGRVMIDGKWVAVKRVVVDISPLLSEAQLEDITDKIAHFNHDEYLCP